MRRILSLAVLAAALAAGVAVRSARSEPEPAAPREFSAAAVEYKGTKLWLPGSFIVKAGERVRITLVNNTGTGKHGWAVPDLGVMTEVADDGKPVAVEFKADKAGLFPIRCQLHPKHIGGQLLVLEK